MTNKSTKRALLMNALSLLVCFSMLIGSTFAWFTDSVISGNNKIVAGNLDIELEYYNGTEWKTVNGATNLFDETLWEPGHTDVVYLRLRNIGSLALKYELAINIVSETPGINMAGDEFLLSDYIYMGVVENINGQTNPYSKDAAGRAKAIAAATNATVISEGYAADGEMAKGANDLYMAVVVYMPTSVDNDANYRGDTAPSIDLGINLVATQLMNEEDSFGNDYDKNAKYLISAGEEMIFNGTAFDQTVVNNGTVDIIGGTINVPQVGLQNNGNATLDGVEMNAGSPADYSNITRGEDAKTEYNNVTVNSAGGGVAAADGAEVVFNSGSVAVNTTSTSGRYLFYAVGEGTVITINGGDFADFTKTSQNQKRAYIYAEPGTTVYVNGGTFGKASTRSGYTAGILGSGTVIITGGTFGFDPSNWVAAGYKAMTVGTNWVVVAEDVTDVVFSADELTNAIANATDGDIIALGSDVTADVTALQVADVDVIIDGYGHTVSSTIYLEGQARYNGAETLTFRNINFVTDSDTAFDFISANSTESAKRYAHNVTVENCTFTATGAGDVVGLRLRQTYNITVKESTFTGMHSVLWGTGISGITVDTVTATNCKNGMSFGTSNGIVVNNCNIEATGEYGYGIRVDASGAYTLSVENSNITAAAPVLLRKATGAYAATLNGNTLTTTGDYQVIVTAGDFEEDVALTAPTGAYTLNGADGLSVYVG